MIRILITGSSGYIGTCVSGFLEKKFDVFTLDKNKYKKFYKKKSNKFFTSNLLNKKKLEKI